MRILLPPSETKRTGGDEHPLDLDAFREPGLNPFRRDVIAAVERLSRDRDEAARVLKLSERQLASIDENAALSASPTRAALDRYTGVLYDALDAPSLDSAARAWIDESVFIQSAVFGRIAAVDRIPSYRLSASSALPGLTLEHRPTSLKAFWVFAHAQQEPNPDAEPAGFTLDMRSKDYVALAPPSPADASAWLNIVQRDASGAVRALNHFNKTAKGQLVRILAQTRPALQNAEDFLDWAAEQRISCAGEEGQQIAVFADSVSLRASQNG